MTVVRADERTRFVQRFAVDDNGCWLWTGSKHRNGYGKFGAYRDGRWVTEQAHRSAWRIYRGPIPDGLQVCHSCDTHECVNPDHLWLGTQAENLADMRSKGRYLTPRRLQAYADVGPKIAQAARRRYASKADGVSA